MPSLEAKHVKEKLGFLTETEDINIDTKEDRNSILEQKIPVHGYDICFPLKAYMRYPLLSWLSYTCSSVEPWTSFSMVVLIEEVESFDFNPLAIFCFVNRSLVINFAILSCAVY